MNNVILTSVISDEGVMLTQVKLELVPGDKRLLHFTLPNEARYTITFDRERVPLNTILQTALASGGQIVGFTEDVKHLNQAFMDLTEPGVRT